MKKHILLAGAAFLLIGLIIIGIQRHRTNSAFLEHIARGDEAYQSEDYQNALSLYQQAYQLKSTTAAQERVTLAQQALEVQLAAAERQFIEVPWIKGAAKNQIIIIGPT
jgi:uncharacterized tellurite resistance protein B-like protein